MKRSVPSRHSMGCTADLFTSGNKKLLLWWEKFDSLSSFSLFASRIWHPPARVAGFRRADPSTTLDKSCIQLWPHSTGSGDGGQELGYVARGLCMPAGGVSTASCGR